MNENKKAVEPFNLFGERSLIYTKDEAARILRDNSYYIFISTALLLAGFSLLLFTKREIFVSKTTVLAFSIYYLFLGVAIRYFKSRVASVLALASYVYVAASRIIDLDMGGLFWGTLIFVAASYRCIKASLFYHKARVGENKRNVQPDVPPDRP